MFELLKVKAEQGRQYIPNLRTAMPPSQHRGRPALGSVRCGECGGCRVICPTRAFTAAPLRIDLGRCLFCGDCQRQCPNGAITFGNDPRIAASSLDPLVVDSRPPQVPAVVPRADLRRLFRRSLKLRQVSAGGCNGCEQELNACGNVNFDMGRYGIEFTASPRHADGIVITGPLTANMAAALRDTYRSVPQPRIVIAAGACAISGGLFAKSPAIDRSFFDDIPIDLYLPGCPPHPLTIINGLLDLIGHE